MYFISQLITGQCVGIRVDSWPLYNVEIFWVFEFFMRPAEDAGMLFVYFHLHCILPQNLIYLFIFFDLD